MDVRHRKDDPADGVIGKARDAFVRALESGDAKAASASYAPDARLLAPSAELFRGRAAIERFWMAGLDAGSRRSGRKRSSSSGGTASPTRSGAISWA